MTDSTFNPDQAAPLIGASTSTIRNWCKLYADVLSDGANPPPGTERRLTTQDVATLQRVKVLRDDRVPPDEIVALLQAAASRQEAAPLTIDVTPTPPSPQNDVAQRSEDLLLPVALSGLQSQVNALRQDLRAVQRNQQRLIDDALHRGRNRGLLLAGVIFGMLIWLIALLSYSPWWWWPW